MKRTIPHPSVTGMASGLAIASYLNAGRSTTVDTPVGDVSVMSEGVIKDITDGELGKAFSTLSGNAIDLIGSDAGRKTLVGASLVAVAGAFAYPGANPSAVGTNVEPGPATFLRMLSAVSYQPDHPKSTGVRPSSKRAILTTMLFSSTCAKVLIQQP